MSWSFLLTSFVICATPGIGALFTMGAGLARGTRAGLLAAFAGTLGTIPHAVAALTGLAALLHASGVAFQAVKYAGVAYLLWMAVATWRDTGALHVDTESAPTSVRSVLTTGITANLLNPKLTLFFVAFLPQFVPAGSSSLPRMAALSGVFMVMTFLTFAVYAVAAGALRDRVLTRPQLVARIRKVFAASFVALSARLAVQQR
ncbi:LysE family translocator [Nocardioides anomalus]|uniref:LysE family translocator n=1 Tax=Nocardioides anomalus TaxID=2712223 RepID=A0A6G6WAI1_9ACTN|nr:LysE family translocator [Nocardioides anomalus]QIG42153.1 LysE family translocator [Nocardioides anomalus]